MGGRQLATFLGVSTIFSPWVPRYIQSQATITVRSHSNPTVSAHSPSRRLYDTSPLQKKKRFFSPFSLFYFFNKCIYLLFKFTTTIIKTMVIITFSYFHPFTFWVREVSVSSLPHKPHLLLTVYPIRNQRDGEQIINSLFFGA